MWATHNNYDDSYSAFHSVLVTQYYCYLILMVNSRLYLIFEAALST